MNKEIKFLRTYKLTSLKESNCCNILALKAFALEKGEGFFFHCHFSHRFSIQLKYRENDTIYIKPMKLIYVNQH